MKNIEKDFLKYKEKYKEYNKKYFQKKIKKNRQKPNDNVLALPARRPSLGRLRRCPLAAPVTALLGPFAGSPRLCPA